MYHHHSQQQGSQSFSNGPRPPHQLPPPSQHQNRNPDMLSHGMGFHFPRPTQLPDELESALAIRGARDMDHRLIDHMNPPNQQQNQSSSSVISQHGSFVSNPRTIAPDNQSALQQGVDWSAYQPPAKLFSGPPPSAGQQAQGHHGPQQQMQSSHTEGIHSWKTSINESQPPQARHPMSSGDSQGLYTSESAGSILASFGLSNEDLEVLSHYPDDQLTPDTLPFILRDIQINKTGAQNTAASASSSTFSCGVQDRQLPPSHASPITRSHSPEVPSLLTVTQTAGKVIDYGHASRAKDESDTRNTFKREQLSSERTVEMYPSSLPPSSAPKTEKVERRQVRLDHAETSKLGDQDYRRTTSDHRKSNRSPGREFPPSKPRNLDQDYRREGLKPRPSSETRSETSLRQSASSSSSKPHSSSSSTKMLPTPTMINDFSAVSPKVYPHTCSLCHSQCDKEKDWVDHINTVNHTAACRDLRNKYPAWKPNPPSRHQRHGSRSSWDSKDQSPAHPGPRSVSCSLSPSPPHSKHRGAPPHHRLHARPYSPHYDPRPHYAGDLPRSSLKRLYFDSKRLSADASMRSSYYKPGHSSKHGLSQSPKAFKSGTKSGIKGTKVTCGKAAEVSSKPPAAKKKKKVGTSASQDSSVADRLVYLTGIPNDASEQEVTDLVGSFGKINNVILMSCSEEESEKGQGQKASVCMVKAEDAQALANSTNLSIREQQITVSTAKKPEEQPPDANNIKPASGDKKGSATEEAGTEAEQKSFDEQKGTLLITGLPETGLSEKDIIKVVQPFGTPSDIILAPQIGKVLVSVPDMETAQEIVKVTSFVPAKIGDVELNITHLKQSIGLGTPVALYNLLMGSSAPLENPVSWSSLLVISNVPNSPSASSEVQKLVRRFGTVIKTLVLNSMVICEMATSAMALSVHKRFQMFPCIIQNNPLFFYRKADTRANAQSKVIAAYLEPSQEAPANGKCSKTFTAADEEETTDKDGSGSLEESFEKEAEEKEKIKIMQKMDVEQETSEENTSKDVKEDELNKSVLDYSAVPDVKQDSDIEANVTETPVMETATEKKHLDVLAAGDTKTAAGEESQLPTPDDEAATQEMPLPELPKVTQAMVNVLLEECRIITTGNSNKCTTPPTCEQQGEKPPQTEGGKKAAYETETEEVAKQQAEEEEKKKQVEGEKKKQEREQKERNAKKEKERRDRERRAREKEERAKRERERDERARKVRLRREEERRDRERRERKRTHGEASAGWRSSNRQRSRRDEADRNSASNTTDEQQEKDVDEFPFNLSDFVTVDEVGDVADLPGSPSPDVCMETTEGAEGAPEMGQKNDPEDTTSEVTVETRSSDATQTQEKSNEPVSESKPVTMSTAEASDGSVLSELHPAPVLSISASLDPPCDSTLSLKQTPTCHPEASKTETTQTATLESTTKVELISTPANSSSNSPAVGVVTPKSEIEKKHDRLNNVQVKNEKEEMMWSGKTNEEEKVQGEEDKETRAAVADTGKRERPEDPEEEMAKKTKTELPPCTDSSLPPFDPSCPVGMEFLVPKTGFFCKVCNRFFSGSKDAEISHCKTLKHYENLQKYFQSKKTTEG